MHGAGREGSLINRKPTSMENASNSIFEENEQQIKSYDGTCFCRLTVVPLNSKTKANPGRWFFRCPLWKNKQGGCNYFQWMDETYIDAPDVAECSTSSKPLKVGNMGVTLQEMRLLPSELPVDFAKNFTGEILGGFIGGNKWPMSITGGF
ncbi:hypothetical protein PIB30_088103 [Stylosanthes scabra]|uniref:GRF-type domain-containing protein n=1 Tax=Stylosanthes scabra TaxID=79078 RepID=A0ABU6STU9_9FABA|nr:hypothetical protein [Stylosanthes scabra]